MRYGLSVTRRDSELAWQIARPVNEPLQNQVLVCKTVIEDPLLKGPYQRHAMELSQIGIIRKRTPAPVRIGFKFEYGRFNSGNESLGQATPTPLGIPGDA